MQCSCVLCFLFFKQKTAYEVRISDWSSDVCSSDLDGAVAGWLSVGGRPVLCRQCPENPTGRRISGIGGNRVVHSDDHVEAREGTAGGSVGKLEERRVG